MTIFFSCFRARLMMTAWQADCCLKRITPPSSENSCENTNRIVLFCHLGFYFRDFYVCNHVACTHLRRFVAGAAERQPVAGFTANAEPAAASDTTATAGSSAVRRPEWRSERICRDRGQTGRQVYVSGCGERIDVRH